MRLRQISKKNRELQGNIRQLQLKLDKVLERNNISLDNDTSQDFQSVMEEEDHHINTKFPEDSFQAIFWKHQKESLHKKGKQKNGNRWHPLMIRWCLYLCHYSSKAYDAIRDSGCIVLPSQRTLCDYSNAIRADAGFSSEVDQQLLQATKLSTSPSYHALQLGYASIILSIIESKSIKHNASIIEVIMINFN